MTLRDARTAAGLTAATAAKALGLSVSYWQRIERCGSGGDRIDRRAAALFGCPNDFTIVRPWSGSRKTRESKRAANRVMRTHHTALALELGSDSSQVKATCNTR
jgi:transcriptional regulator with XRE-family HTH domain